MIVSFGLVLSFAWFCVNRGSKKWQENWENHVDMLEDEFIGPLHKTVSERPRPQDVEDRDSLAKRKLKQFFTGPADFSVSKINQIVSIFVTGLWASIAFIETKPFSDRDLHHFDVFSAIIFAMAVLTCGLIWRWGRSHGQNYEFIMRQRESTVVLPKRRGE